MVADLDCGALPCACGEVPPPYLVAGKSRKCHAVSIPKTWYYLKTGLSLVNQTLSLVNHGKNNVIPTVNTSPVALIWI